MKIQISVDVKTPENDTLNQEALLYGVEGGRVEFNIDEFVFIANIDEMISVLEFLKEQNKK